MYIIILALQRGGDSTSESIMYIIILALQRGGDSTSESIMYTIILALQRRGDSTSDVYNVFLDRNEGEKQLLRIHTFTFHMSFLSNVRAGFTSRSNDEIEIGRGVVGTKACS